MKKALVGLAFVLVFYLVTGQEQSVAQEIQDEVGITEHLDTLIPQGLIFKNEQGQEVDLKSLVTRPTIFVLIYLDCPGICPQILSSVGDVIEKMGMEMGKDFQVITVSFNPDDTPADAVEMKPNFLREHSKLHETDWIYLTGDSANISRLTNTVGYHFTRAGNDFIHPSVIMVLSPDAKITRYLYGTTYLPFDVKMALIEAQKGQSRPTINRVLEYCFAYDPEGRKYTLQVTKIAATIIIFFAVVLFVILIVKSKRRKPASSGKQ
jgi:protein SCO1/2